MCKSKIYVVYLFHHVLYSVCHHIEVKYDFKLSSIFIYRVSMIQAICNIHMSVLHLNTSHKSTHLMNPKILPAGDGEYDGDVGMDGA